MKAQVAVVTIGTMQFPGYQLESGEYGMSLTGLGEICNKADSSVRRFIASTAIKTMIEAGSIVRHNVSAIVTAGKNISFTFVGTDIATKYIFGQAVHGSGEATAICIALLDVSLNERIKVSFGGKAATLQEMQQAEAVIMSRELERQRTKDAHMLFCNAVEVFGINAAKAHDYITLLISGWTAQDAREQGYLLPDTDETIGLNYQDDPYLLRWIADAKVKFGTYRKGTWQERCERAVTDTKPA